MSVKTDVKSAPSVARTLHMPQDSTHNRDVYVALPSRIIDDRDFPARVRILAWLIAHGASPLRPVRVHQAALARELRVARSTVQDAIYALLRGEYIAGTVNPLTDGRVHSYRLLFSHERKGATV